MDAIWGKARCLDELGAAMAGWLEGRVKDSPSNRGKPETETGPLVPVLARVNRRGLVTTMSQPGEGGAYEQRAAVHGWMSDGPALDKLIRRARAAGLLVSAHGAGRAVGPRRDIPVSRCYGEVTMTVGGRIRFGQVRGEWAWTGWRVRRIIRRSVLVSVVDPVWGRAASPLWPFLADVLS